MALLFVRLATSAVQIILQADIQVTVSERDKKKSVEIISLNFALDNKNDLLLMVKLFTVNTKIKCKYIAPNLRNYNFFFF